MVDVLVVGKSEVIINVVISSEVNLIHPAKIKIMKDRSVIFFMLSPFFKC